MGTIQIDGTDYEIMGTDLAEVDAYIKGSVGAGSDAWAVLVAAEDDDGRAKLVVAATRYLYRQKWQGTATVSTQKTAFPRDGVVDPDGTALADGATPQNLVFAEAEMAAIFAADASVAAAADSGSNIQSLNAGPVSISYFRPTIGADAGATKMPVTIMDLVAGYLASGIADDAPTAYGFSSCEAETSSFDDCAQFTRRGPFI